MKNRFIKSLLCLLLVGNATSKTIPNHAIADRVLGQPDFTTSGFTAPYTSFKMNGPETVLVDPVTRKVYVGESNGDRILRFANAASLANGAPAEAVLGQANFSNNGDVADATGVTDPSGLFLDRYGRLWVASELNNRVLVFEAAAYRDTGSSADLVFGQPNFTTTTSGTTAAKMSAPTGVWIDANDSLWVADSGNNRVLRFASISTKNSGANADGVLGQALFTTFAAGSGTTGLQAPESVAVSPTGTLYVTCRNGNRVMRFNNAAILADGAAASAVLGQPDFSTVTSGLTAAKFSSPRGLFLTADDSLWVADDDNNRVVRFSSVSTKGTGSAADGVVGQPNFTTNTATTTNRGLNSPSFSPFVDATGNLWVPDTSNDRVLRFPPDVIKPLIAVTSTVPKTTPKKKLQIKGTASDAFGISKVQYRIGTGPLKTANGTTTWQFNAPLKLGKNKITIFSTDSVGNVSVNRVVKVKRTEK